MRGGVQRHSCGARLERRQSAIGVADAFGEDRHAVAAGQDVVHALEGAPVVRVGSVFFAAQDGYRAERLKQTGEYGKSPELRVAEEMNGEPFRQADQQQSVDQGVGVIASKDHGAALGHILQAHHLDSPIKRAGDQTQESNEPTVEHGRRCCAISVSIKLTECLRRRYRSTSRPATVWTSFSTTIPQWRESRRARCPNWQRRFLPANGMRLLLGEVARPGRDGPLSPQGPDFPTRPPRPSPSCSPTRAWHEPEAAFRPVPSRGLRRSASVRIEAGSCPTPRDASSPRLRRHRTHRRVRVSDEPLRPARPRPDPAPARPAALGPARRPP